MIKRDFLSLLDFSSDELKHVIKRAKSLRKQHESGEVYQPLVGKTGALILTMSSTRTRVAFEAGFAGDFLAALGDLAAGLAALGDLRSARSARTPSTRRRTPPSRLALAAGLAAFGDFAAGLGLFLGVAFFGAGLRRRAVARIT